MTNGKKVLLTGITGFLGSHTAIRLLEKGYQVTGTMRNLRRSESIKAVIARHSNATANLTLVEADISDPDVWKRLMKGMDYVQHIASPFPKTLPKSEDELIIPARDGNLNILSAASAAGVKRVVITSSSAAISYGQPADKRRATLDETSWSDENVSEDIRPYYKSKTIAEKAAWKFMKSDASGMELSVVCPSLILGPLLEEDFSASANVIIKLIDGRMPAIPQIGFEVVDVRSVVSLLLLAMEEKRAAGNRYIGSSGYCSMNEIAGILKKAYPKMKIPSGKLPDWLLRIFSVFDGTLKPILIDLGAERKLDHGKAVSELGWRPIAVTEAVTSSAESILELGLVQRR